MAVWPSTATSRETRAVILSSTFGALAGNRRLEPMPITVGGTYQPSYRGGRLVDGHRRGPKPRRVRRLRPDPAGGACRALGNRRRVVVIRRRLAACGRRPARIARSGSRASSVRGGRENWCGGRRRSCWRLDHDGCGRRGGLSSGPLQQVGPDHSAALWRSATHSPALAAATMPVPRRVTRTSLVDIADGLSAPC